MSIDVEPAELIPQIFRRDFLVTHMNLANTFQQYPKKRGHQFFQQTGMLDEQLFERGIGLKGVLQLSHWHNLPQVSVLFCNVTIIVAQLGIVALLY